MRAQGGGIEPGPRTACAEKARRGIAPAGLLAFLGDLAIRDALRVLLFEGRIGRLAVRFSLRPIPYLGALLIGPPVLRDDRPRVQCRLCRKMVLEFLTSHALESFVRRLRKRAVGYIGGSGGCVPSAVLFIRKPDEQHGTVFESPFFGAVLDRDGAGAPAVTELCMIREG